MTSSFSTPPGHTSTPYLSLEPRQTPPNPPPSQDTWVTVLLPIYNEPPPILNRLLQACTSSHHNRYDVAIANDSNNLQTHSALEDWKHHEKIRIIQRPYRDEFKSCASFPIEKYSV